MNEEPSQPTGTDDGPLNREAHELLNAWRTAR